MYFKLILSPLIKFSSSPQKAYLVPVFKTSQHNPVAWSTCHSHNLGKWARWALNKIPWAESQPWPTVLSWHFKQLAPERESWMLKPRGQSRVLAQGRLTIIVRLPVTPSNEGKTIYMSKSGKDAPLPGHLHNSRKSTNNQVKQHSGVKQIMMHSWRQRSCNSIQLHHFNWVLKKSEAPTVVSWRGGGRPRHGAAAPLFVRNCGSGPRRACPTRRLAHPRLGIVATLKKNWLLVWVLRTSRLFSGARESTAGRRGLQILPVRGLLGKSPVLAHSLLTSLNRPPSFWKNWTQPECPTLGERLNDVSYMNAMATTAASMNVCRELLITWGNAVINVKFKM